MLVFEVDALGNGLLLEKVVFFIDERNHIGLAHTHYHLSLVNLSEVHHLVDEVKDTFRVLSDNLVDALTVRLFVFLDQGEQWGDNQCQWRTDFVTDVHEELDLRLAHLFGVDVLLQDELVFHLALAVAQVEHDGCYEEQQIEELCPDAGIPGWVNDDGELLHRCFVAVADGLDAVFVAAGSHVREGKFVLSGWNGAPGIAVDAVGVSYLLHIIIGEGRELQGEGVVIVREIEFPCHSYPAVRDSIAARLHAWGHCLVVDHEARDNHLCLPWVLLYPVGLEPVESARATHQNHLLILGGAYGSIAELVALQSAFGIKPDDAAILGVQHVESAVCTQPYFALVVFSDTRHTVVGESLGCGIMFRLYSLSEVKAEGSILGAIPYMVFAIYKHAVRKTVLVQAVDALEGGNPAVSLAVEARQSHRGGYIHMVAIL